MTMKDLRKFMSENYYMWIGFTKKIAIVCWKKKDLVVFATNVNK